MLILKVQHGSAGLVKEFETLLDKYYAVTVINESEYLQNGEELEKENDILIIK